MEPSVCGCELHAPGASPIWMPLGCCSVMLFETITPVSNLSDVLGCPIKTPACDSAEYPEWEDFVEAGGHELERV